MGLISLTCSRMLLSADLKESTPAFKKRQEKKILVFSVFLGVLLKGVISGRDNLYVPFTLSGLSCCDR